MTGASGRSHTIGLVPWLAVRPPRAATAVTAALALVASACSEPAVLEEPSTTAPVVAVDAARRETMRNSVSTVGTVVAAAAGDWTIAAPQAGQIAELPVDVGDEVEAGDLLVRFEIPAITHELNSRQVELADAQVAADAARTEADRQRILMERGILPRNDYETARAAVSATEAAMDQARVNLQLAEAAAARTEVRARFAGVVADRFHIEGEFVAGGADDPVLRLVDPTRVQVSVQLTAAELERVPPGQTVTVQSAVSAPASGRVVLRPEAVEAGAAAADVRIDIVDGTYPPLNTPVFVDIDLGTRPDVLTVPEAALLGEGLDRWVLRADPDGFARRQDVRVGLVTEGRAQIVQGLSEGDLVIVRGQDDVLDGDAITIGR